MHKLIRLATAAVVSATLTTGVAAAQSTISTTGPNSWNWVHSSNRNHVSVDNDNHVSVHNNNHQAAYTGTAVVSNSTNAGDATTGDASNDNTFDATVNVDNSGSGAWVAGMSTVGSGGDSGGSIDTTGPNSHNAIDTQNSNSVRVDNDNNVYVHNDNTQCATSGDATVTNTTNGGSATTGNASNTNSSTFDLSVSN
ncbi:MAG TPA: hypothetical protein VFT49_02115 [Candidatus Saccharimonadales bacterium]|nr:hypothetical protein [Candidatus Saccharimonadales bacterium]